MSYITSLLSTSEEREALEQQFKILDKDKDGKLSFKELQAGYKKVFGEQITLQQLKSLFNAIDTDQSGYIDFQEFISAAMDAQQMLSKQKIKQVFDIIDKDKSGSICMRELKMAFGSVRRGGKDFLKQL